MDGSNETSHIEASAIHLLHRAGQCAEEFFSREIPDGTLT
ncbi:MAG: MarR family transcriptional regulator, partial [Alphaproteobacteria bacterium]